MDKQALRTLQAEQAEPEQQRNVYQKTDQELVTYLKTKIPYLLKTQVPYLNNPSEDSIFGSNKIKEQHETMKLQIEEVMLETLKTLINKLNKPGSIGIKFGIDFGTHLVAFFGLKFFIRGHECTW